MSNFFVEMEGFNDLKTQIDKITEDGQTQANKDILKKCGEMTQARAKQLAPKSEDHMKSGVKHKNTPRLIPPTSLADGIPLSCVKGQNKTNMSITVG